MVEGQAGALGRDHRQGEKPVHVALRKAGGCLKKLKAWLESTQNPGQSGLPPEESVIALRCWNTMQGIDWDALEIIAEYYGVQDINLLIHQLITIRDHASRV